MAEELTNGATVETKAIFTKIVVNGKTEYRRLPFNVEIRTYPTEAKGGRQSYIAFSYGPPPGRANAFDTAKGEAYDAVEYYDVYPATWPRIGVPKG